MAIIEWTDDLSVGIAEFDGHHRRMLELINELHEARFSGNSRTAVGQVLLALSNYVIYHFLAEEEAMQRYKYPEFETHKQEHLKLTEKTLEFVSGFHRGSVDITKDLLDFLVSWLQNHIRTVDKKYRTYLNSCGVS